MWRRYLSVALAVTLAVLPVGNALAIAEYDVEYDAAYAEIYDTEVFDAESVSDLDQADDFDEDVDLSVDEADEAEEIILDLADDAVEEANGERAGVVSFSAIYINPIYRNVVSESDFEAVELGLDLSEYDNVDLEQTAGIMSLYSGEYAQFYNIEEAGLYARQAVKNREEVIEFDLLVKQDVTISYAKSVSDQILDIVYQHTGDPKEGDFIQYNLIGYSGSYSFYSYDDTYDCISLYYRPAYCTTLAEEQELDQAVEDFLSTLHPAGKTDAAIIKEIYDYITSNVEYDYDNLYDDDHWLKYSAYAAMVNGTSVCQGYAGLLYRLLMEAGIDTRVISGIGNGGDHAWNIVKIGDKYYNCDATWDAGLNNYWCFLLCEENFKDHARDMQYKTAEFMAAYPMSATDYVFTSEDLHVHLSGSVVYENRVEPTATTEGSVDNVIYCIDCGKEISRITVILPIEAPEQKCGEQITCSLNSDGCLIIEGTGAMYDFTGGDQPWAGKDVTELLIKDGVTSIGDNAFKMTNITKVTFPATLTSIGKNAFQDCKKLEQVVLPKSLKELGYAAFGGCSSLQSVKAENGCAVSFAKGSTFMNCGNLSEVILPDTVTDFTGNVLSLSKKLKAVTVIGSACKWHKNNPKSGNILIDVDILDDHDYEISLTVDSFSYTNYVQTCKECGRSISLRYKTEADGNVTITWFETDLTSYKVTIPSYIDGKPVTMIGNSAFQSKDQIRDLALKEVVLPDTVTKIDAGAFSNAHFSRFRMSKNIQYIAPYAFEGCSELEYIDLPESLIDIGPSAFCDCVSLKDVVLPGNLNSIDGSAFENTGITSITIPGYLKVLQAGVFRECKNLEEVTIEEGIWAIGSGNFADCPRLRTVHLPESLTVGNTDVFTFCPALTDIYHAGFASSVDLSTMNDAQNATWHFAKCRVMFEYGYTRNFDIINTGEKATMPAVDSTGDPEFAGWFTDPEYTHIFSFDTPVTTDITLYAKWTSKADHIRKYCPYIAPTCVESGEEEHYWCYDCQKYYWSPDEYFEAEEGSWIIPARGHELEYLFGYESTCTTPGLTDGSYCVECGETIEEQEELPLIAHEYETMFSTYVEPTCTTDGREADQKCIYCDNELAGDAIPAYGHHEVSFGSDYEPDCTSAGLISGTYCLECGDTIKEPIDLPPLGHDYKTVAGTGKPAACITSGRKPDQECSRCHNVISGDIIPATGTHTWSSWTTVKAATAIATGLKRHTCTVCKTTEDETIAKLPGTIKLSAKSKTLKVKKTYTLKITGLAKGDAIKSVTSSKKTIAAVAKIKNKTGQYKITAKKKGKATITVKLKSGTTATCTITVK